MHHNKLTREERYQIQWSREKGFSAAQIARDLKRHASTIGRELKRNGTVDKKGRCVAYKTWRVP